jgi:integrase
MREAGRRSGYMPLSGTASGRPLMINSVSRRRHRQILLATFPRPETAFPQLKSPFKATRRRNLRLDGLTTLEALQVARATRWRPAEVLTDAEVRELLTVLYRTGLRTQEALNLKPADIA